MVRFFPRCASLPTLSSWETPDELWKCLGPLQSMGRGVTQIRAMKMNFFILSNPFQQCMARAAKPPIGESAALSKMCSRLSVELFAKKGANKGQPTRGVL